MYTSEKTNELALAYFEKYNQLVEKRRQIDYDMTNNLKSLENNNQTVDGKLAVLEYKNKIVLEEEFYLQVQQELSEISEDFIPILVAVNANRHDRLYTQIGGDVFIDSFLDENGKIISSGPVIHID
ncbi:hypothetical protein ABE426_16140 [Sphingobacterium faecium]|uniref:hypothetical protein n=1 Tax=Sphingobacterium faecium TaxID=34087 RepID=UPI00320A2033